MMYELVLPKIKSLGPPVAQYLCLFYKLVLHGIASSEIVLKLAPHTCEDIDQAVWISCDEGSNTQPMIGWGIGG
jgi:hypothetical protein